jgi:hypothetical protein
MEIISERRFFMIDARVIVFLAGAIIALVLGGYGLYKIAFQRGYVIGHEDAMNPDGEIGFKPEDKE